MLTYTTFEYTNNFSIDAFLIHSYNISIIDTIIYFFLEYSFMLFKILLFLKFQEILFFYLQFGIFYPNSTQHYIYFLDGRKTDREKITVKGRGVGDFGLWRQFIKSVNRLLMSSFINVFKHFPVIDWK